MMPCSAPGPAWLFPVCVPLLWRMVRVLETHTHWSSVNLPNAWIETDERVVDVCHMDC